MIGSPIRKNRGPEVGLRVYIIEVDVASSSLSSCVTPAGSAAGLPTVLLQLSWNLLLLTVGLVVELGP